MALCRLSTLLHAIICFEIILLAIFTITLKPFGSVSVSDSFYFPQGQRQGKEQAATTTTTTTMNSLQQKLAKTPPDQPIDFQIPVLPPPNIANNSSSSSSTLVVLVPSHPKNFVKRQAIRETWMAAAAKHNATATILFVVAQSNCEDEFESTPTPTSFEITTNFATHPKQNYNNSVEEAFEEVRRRVRLNQELEARTTLSETTINIPCDQIDHNFLRPEQERNQDLLEIPFKERYDRLPEKMMQAYHWVLTNIQNVGWIAKADDDMFVRVQNLERYLRKYNPDVPMLIGEIIYHSGVPKEGKWAEFDYPHDFYPYWPKGSAGHVLSRAAAKYFTETSESLHRYQGEDTSIGIWLDEARKTGRLKDVTYIHAKDMFGSTGILACDQEQYMIVGHDLSPDDLVYCQNKTTTTTTTAGGNSGFSEVAWIDEPADFEGLIREEEEENEYYVSYYREEEDE